MNVTINRGSLLYAVICIILPVTLSVEPAYSSSSASGTISSEVSKGIRNRVSAGFSGRITIKEDVIYAPALLPLFYERRAYLPAWSNDGGLLPYVNSLIKAVRKAYEEGLRPEDYHLITIETILKEIRRDEIRKKPPDAGKFVNLDLLLTDSFLLYGTHLLSGKVNPETIDPEWFADRRKVNMVEVLEKSLAENRIESGLKDLLPPYREYSLLKEALKRYRKIASAGGWPAVPDGPKMQKGDVGDRVIALCERLALTGDFASQEADSSDVFSEDLDKAVRKFQERHGLYVDGVVGTATLSSLNVSVYERINRIKLNMERWRWLPQDLGQRYIIVNAAGFKLDLIEDGNTVMTMRVVVGKHYRKTPVFSGKMTYLVLSPYWHIPANIAVKDKLPLIRKDSGYLSRENIRVFRGWGARTEEVDPQTVDWTKVTPRNFHYRLIQQPGPLNALGRIKFMFPNRFNVYLHDTPSRELFARTVRSFSSGCIRIEKPIELAEYLLKDKPKWTKDEILSEIKKRKERIVPLKNPVPVHVLYWTAWANNDGSINFRNDIYVRDESLSRALKGKPSSR